MDLTQLKESVNLKIDQQKLPKLKHNVGQGREERKRERRMERGRQRENMIENGAYNSCGTISNGLTYM